MSFREAGDSVEPKVSRFSGTCLHSVASETQANYKLLPVPALARCLSNDAGSPGDRLRYSSTDVCQRVYRNL